VFGGLKIQLVENKRDEHRQNCINILDRISDEKHRKRFYSINQKTLRPKKTMGKME
jgi:hypothetical protein